MMNRESMRGDVLWGGLVCLLGCASPAPRPEPASGIERSTKIHMGQAAATWKSIAAGRSTTLGVKQDGSLWAWGWNGQLGVGAPLYRTTPAKLEIP
jgi:alpha-tubulin suppressor-like RCC1 family protein